MLLSIFLSFVFVRKLKGKKCATLIVAFVVVASFFSAFGWITIHQRTDFTNKTVQWYRFHPVPLSFPVYASVFYGLTVVPLPIDLSTVTYQIDFLTFEITRLTTYYSSFTLRDASVYYSLFLSLNIVGAFIGYWINKSTTPEKYPKNKVEQQSNKHSRPYASAHSFSEDDDRQYARNVSTMK